MQDQAQIQTENLRSQRIVRLIFVRIGVTPISAEIYQRKRAWARLEFHDILPNLRSRIYFIG